jgi:Zn-dependent protease
MHEPRPSEPGGESLPAEQQPQAPPVYRGYEPVPPPYAPQQPHAPQQQRKGWRAAGGVVAAGALFLAKFKAVLFVLLNAKWLLFLPKLFALFASIWLYALFFGWKFGIVFVLLILVHELGHYLTFRNFGIKADLPFFIPGFGAFVAARGPAPSLTVEAIATLAGPIFGIGASAICYGYATSTGEPFWYAAAYVGFFLNALNLLPIPPLDGGGIAGAIDPRLWIVGAFAFVAFIVMFGAGSLFAYLMLGLVALAAIPRLRALFQGRVDPRLADVRPLARWTIAAAYFAVMIVAVIGAVASHARVPIGGAT